jgi:hypothetical protein
MIESLESMIVAVMVIVLRRPEYVSEKHLLFGNMDIEL